MVIHLKYVFVVFQFAVGVGRVRDGGDVRKVSSVLVEQSGFPQRTHRLHSDGQQSAGKVRTKKSVEFVYKNYIHLL